MKKISHGCTLDCADCCKFNVYVKNDDNLNFGEFIKCKVTKVDEYDLVAEKIKK